MDQSGTIGDRIHREADPLSGGLAGAGFRRRPRPPGRHPRAARRPLGGAGLEHAARAYSERRCAGRGHLPRRQEREARGHHGGRGWRRGVLPGRAQGYSRGHEGAAQGRGSRAPRGHRRRRQYWLPAGDRAGGPQPGEAHRARREARPARVRAVEKHDGAARRRGGRRAAAGGEHRQRRCIRGPDQFRGGEYSVRHARQAPGRSQGHGLDQQALLRRAHRERLDRRGHLSADRHHRIIAGACAPRRRGAGALIAARRRGGTRSGGARRGRQLESDRPAHRGHCIARGHHAGRGGARRGCHHRASRHHGAARRSSHPVPDGSPAYRGGRKLFQGSASFL